MAQSLCCFTWWHTNLIYWVPLISPCSAGRGVFHQAFRVFGLLPEPRDVLDKVRPQRDSNHQCFHGNVLAVSIVHIVGMPFMLLSSCFLVMLCWIVFVSASLFPFFALCYWSKKLVQLKCTLIYAWHCWLWVKH